MALLDTYEPMREYISNYICSKTSFDFNVVFYDDFHTVMIHVISGYDMPFKNLMCRLKELEINFKTDYTWGYEDEYIVMTEDEYLKLYTLCSLKNEF